MSGNTVAKFFKFLRPFTQKKFFIIITLEVLVLFFREGLYLGIIDEENQIQTLQIFGWNDKVSIQTKSVS